MDVKITRGQHNRVEVQFHYWEEKDRSRLFRIEMDILKRVGFLGTGKLEPGKPRILYRDPPLSEFTEQNIQDIVKVLEGYTILPTITTENDMGRLVSIEET